MCKIFQKIYKIGILTGLILAVSPVWNAFSASSQQTASYAGDLDTYVQNQMETYNLPGLALAVVHRGEIEYIQGYGIANDSGAPVTPDTSFLLASVSKSFTAVGIMQLVEAGKLRLDDPVGQHLPWFDVASQGGGSITVSDLLYQTSGLSEKVGVNMTLRTDHPDALEMGVRDLSKERLVFQPGSGWEYSNSNYDILGLLIQQISGQTYETYIQEHIFAPLEMNHSYTSLSDARAGYAASGYYPFFGFPINYDNLMPYSRATLPSAGIWSSARDMGRYLIAHLNAEESAAPGFLSGESTALLHQPGAETEPGYYYAMGWFETDGFWSPDKYETLDAEFTRLDYNDVNTLWHEGGWANYKSVAMLLPEMDLGVVILMNMNNHPISSVFRYFAWDVAFIAMGGDIHYATPGESFFIRNSRWILSLVILGLVVMFIWSLKTLRKIRYGELDQKPASVKISFILIPGLIDASLLGYVFLKFLPENRVSLAALVRHVPDLGLLFLLLLILSGIWGALRLILSIYLLQKRK